MTTEIWTRASFQQLPAKFTKAPHYIHSTYPLPLSLLLATKPTHAFTNQFVLVIDSDGSPKCPHLSMLYLSLRIDRYSQQIADMFSWLETTT